MKFSVSPEIFEAFPGLRVGMVVARGIDNRGVCPGIRASIEKIQKDIRIDLSPESLIEQPKIQSWRKAYAVFGAKPRKHRSSVESLYRMTLEGKDFRSINKIVDVYNYISLKHMIPVGGDDLAKVEGHVVLKFARGEELFTPLGSDEVQTARQGEVIYMDEKDVLCRRWNWRECEKTKMTEESRDVLLISEGLPPVGPKEMEEIVDDLSQWVERYCGGKITRSVLDEEKNEWEL
jgi:DNA/RNA-binding domain of Phe-tRNA-synthetase-like protein